MTINVSPEVEQSILAAVRSGRFPSVDEAVATAWREWDRTHAAPRAPLDRPPVNGAAPSLGSIGAMRDSAAELDEIVAEAYRQRRVETWRELDL